jgi:hypothetical protein
MRDFYDLNRKDKAFYDMMLAERNERKKNFGAWAKQRATGTE